MPASSASVPPKLPIPIFQPSATIPRYLLYDINHITYLRSHHAILGVLVGSLPQIPQQSVFLGLPLELQPEEAQLLVDKGIGYIVNDRVWHDGDFRQKCGHERQALIQRLHEEGLEIAKDIQARRKVRTAQILQEKQVSKVKKAKRKEEDQVEREEDTEEQPLIPEKNKDGEKSNIEEPDAPTTHEDDQLFDRNVSQPRSRSRSNSMDPTPHLITPTTSTSLSNPPAPPSPSLPSKPSSNLLTPLISTTYPLFAHLNSQGYYLSPGLRFGCHFSAYPGDPLRFHSHFLANALAWDEEFDLMDLVGGGRLGTGVKKGWLVGGRVEEEGDEEEETEKGGRERREGEVRCFSIEWGGM